LVESGAGRQRTPASMAFTNIFFVVQELVKIIGISKYSGVFCRNLTNSSPLHIRHLNIQQDSSFISEIR
jgi:prophage antirepressor-like protein